MLVYMAIYAVMNVGTFAFILSMERDGVPVFVVLPQAQAGRPVTVDWPLTTRLIDEGRFTLPQQATR